MAGLDDLLLLVSEVAANAVRHSASGDGGEFEVAVSVTGPGARGDRRPGRRVRTTATGQDGPADALTGGRGLRIVDALAAEWGHAGDELGRVVWFEVAC